MIKNILIFLTISLFLATAAPAGVEVRSPGLPDNFTPSLYQPLRVGNGGAFKVGERLVYDIHWSGLETGMAVLEVLEQTTYRGTPAYHFVATAQSAPNISKIYPVNDRIDSFADVRSFHSYLYIRHLREGFYKHDSTTTVDHEKGKASFKGKVYSTKPGVKDDLCGVYYFRTLKDLAPGKSFTAEVFAYKKTWEVEAKVLGRERVVTAAGAFDTLKVELLLKQQDRAENPGRVVFWMTDDERRLPVMLQVQVLVGSFYASLREYKLE